MLNERIVKDLTDTVVHPQELIPPPAKVQDDRFFADLKQFAADLERLVGQAKTLSGEGAVVARRRLGVLVADAMHRLNTAGGVATEHALVARDSAERHVRDDPWKSIALAVATGMLVAFFASRR